MKKKEPKIVIGCSWPILGLALLILKLTGVLTSWGWWFLIGACFIPGLIILVTWIGIMITIATLGIVFGGKR
jgi:hypothetical protein